MVDLSMAMLNNQMVIIAKIRAALGLNIGKDEETYLPANYCMADMETDQDWPKEL